MNNIMAAIGWLVFIFIGVFFIMPWTLLFILAETGAI